MTSMTIPTFLYDMDISVSDSEIDEEMNCDDNTKAEDLAKLKKCMFKLIFKIEHNYDKEEKVFSNAKVLRILQKDLMPEL